MTQNLVILASTQSLAHEIERVLAEKKWPVQVAVRVAEGAASVATANTRSAFPAFPLAVVASEEADALEALAAGADEALVLPTIDARSVELLMERTSARARVRMTHASAQGNVAHAEKLAALGTVVAGVAHEINNPLSSVLLFAGALKLQVGPLLAMNEELQRRAAEGRGLSPEDVQRLVVRSRTGSGAREARAMLEDMEANVQTIADIVRDLRIYARADENEEPQIVDVTRLLDQVLRIVGPQIEARGHIERDYAPELPALALPRSRIVQVLTNILVNAGQAIGEVQRPIHRVRVVARADAEFVAVSIADTGPGIAPEILERVFDPFFTTKEIGAGTGLGLAISQQILRRLGGDLIVESVHGEGATFIALLPVPDAATMERTRRARSPRDQVLVSSSKRPVILVVEDDERLLRAYPRTLHAHYDVITASDGQEAIDLLVSGSPADAVVTDLAMPEVDGQGFYEWLVEHRPALARKTLFVTAGARTARSAAFLESLQTNLVLDKPVTREQLLAAIGRVLEQ
ncbi:MAG TPA: ATP-binding protein [Polyangiaceae bacterium]|nr:ATP-binding protein [Polyangiaceae bacterium]